jgi:hypothetical protein
MLSICSGKAETSMQKPTRYYITKSGEEPTVRSVRVELPAAASLEETRRAQGVETNATMDTSEQRRSVKDLVQVAIQKRQFFS